MHPDPLQIPEDLLSLLQLIIGSIDAGNDNSKKKKKGGGWQYYMNFQDLELIQKTNMKNYI